MGRTSLALALSPNAAGSSGALDVPAAFSNIEGLWRPWRGLYTLVSGKYSQIDDESGHARHITQATGIFRPLFGEEDDVAFASVDGGQVMEIPEAFGQALGTNNFSIWWVAETDDLSANEGYFATSYLGGVAGTIEGAAKRTLRRQGGGTNVDGDAAINTRELWIVSRDAGTLHLYVNDVEQSITSPTAGIGSPSGLGAVFALDTTLTYTLSGKGFEWAGKSGGSLTSGERTALFGYADALYGLT